MNPESAKEEAPALFHTFMFPQHQVQGGGTEALPVGKASLCLQSSS